MGPHTFYFFGRKEHNMSDFMAKGKNDVVKGDMVRFFVNKRALKENKYFMGEVLSTSGCLVKVKSLKFKTPMFLHKNLVFVVKPAITKDRLKFVFADNMKTQEKKRKKKEVVNKVGNMSFSFKKQTT